MHYRGLTWKILLGMAAGAIIGLLLMVHQPVGLQPGDRLVVTWGDGEQESIRIADTDRTEKTLDVIIEGSERGHAVLETAQTAGAAVLAGGQEVQLAGLSREDGLERIAEAAGRDVRSLEIEQRRQVTLMPPVTQVFYVIGELFIRLLKMLIVPLIVATVLVGIASLGDVGKMGRLGAQALGYYAVTTLAAAGVGLTLVNLVNPGEGLNLSIAPDAGGLAAESPSVTDLILRIVPTNPVEAMAQFDVLGMLFFTIILALGMLRVGKETAHALFRFFESLNEVVYVLIGWVMALAPIGVAALLAYFIGIQDPAYLGGLLRSLGSFAACVVGGLLIHAMFLTFLVAVLGRYSPLQFLKKATPCLTTAFSTASSSATLPVTLGCLNDMKVSKRIYSFVLPVGATANMDGTALYEAAAAIFFAQAFGIELSVGQQLIVVVTAMLAAVGAAGIPSAGLVTMALVLTAVGLPLTGIGLLFAIDRPLDMLRTAVNVYGDASASRVLQTWNPGIRAEEDEEVEEAL